MSDKLELRAGAYYRTRDGRRAFVDCLVGPNPFKEQDWRDTVIGYIDGLGPMSWKASGEYLGKVEDDRDLVAEWREPHKVEVVFCRYPNGDEMWYASTMPGSKWPHAVARKVIEIPEGEGV